MSLYKNNDPTKCCESVATAGLRMHYHQCTRPVYIEINDKKYCRIHSPAYVAEKRKKSSDAFDAAWKERVEKAKQLRQDKLDAARWRAVPEFLAKYQIDYVGLLRDVDEFIGEKNG